MNSGKADLDDYLQENCLVDFDGKPMSRDRRSEESRGRERARERHTSHQVKLTRQKPNFQITFSRPKSSERFILEFLILVEFRQLVLSFIRVYGVAF